jgi:hypothetical protein
MIAITLRHSIVIDQATQTAYLEAELNHGFSSARFDASWKDEVEMQTGQNN